jgi:hypothetical protein
MSFTEVTDKIKQTLEDDQDLANWVSSIFSGKFLNVIKAFKNRQEINVADLPVAMIVRPSRSYHSQIIGASPYFESTVLLYVGFYCEDRNQAQDILVVLDEEIEAALLKNRSLSGKVQQTMLEAVETDAGQFHPHYFFVQQWKILS